MVNYSKTRQRELLLEVIREAEGPVTARELLRRAMEKDESIGHATVYRSLILFKQLGLVNERRLGQAQCYYEAKKSPEHQHLVCRECGKVIDFACPLQEVVEKVKRDNGFTVTRAEVYMEGYCSECNMEKEMEK
ncbi:Fur family transcriptional regulator [Chloroflexota bacterium]